MYPVIPAQELVNLPAPFCRHSRESGSPEGAPPPFARFLDTRLRGYDEVKGGVVNKFTAAGATILGLLP